VLEGSECGIKFRGGKFRHWSFSFIEEENRISFSEKGYIQSIYHSYGNCGWILFPGSWGGLLLSQSIFLVESLQIFILFFISCWF